jgi:hypothetical protein
MSIIAEYGHEPIRVLDAIHDVPEMTVRYDEAYFAPDRRVKWVFWASGGDFAPFDESMAADPDVDAFDVLLDDPDRRLYSATLANPDDDFVLETVNRLDIQLLDSTHSHARSVVRVRCPSREAYATLRDALEDKHGPVVTRRLYREEPLADVDLGLRVTSPQREALLAALEAGYFEVPRGTTLEEVAATLGISDQALSARLRRGTATLLRDTLDRRDP